MNRILFFIIIAAMFSCEKNNFDIASNADEYFFLRNKGADMPVWVKGNTASKTFIVVLHGGPGSGSVGTADAVKSFKILQQNFAIVYWDQRGAGITQGNYNASTINANQMVEDLEKLIVLIKAKYGNDINLFLQGGSWGGYLGFAYLVKGDNQNNIKGWIDENGAHNISLTANSARRLLVDYANKFIEKNINTSKWQRIKNWCTDVDTITTTSQFEDVNSLGFDATELISDSISKEDIDMTEIAMRQLFGPLSSHQLMANYDETDDESPLMNNFIELNLSPDLNRVTIPCMFVGGKFDLIVPNEVLYDAYNKVSSEHKEIHILNRSGHSPSSTEPKEFAFLVKMFIQGCLQ